MSAEAVGGDLGKDGVGVTGRQRDWTVLARLWEGRPFEWTGVRSEQLFEGMMGKLEGRRRRRRMVRMAITLGGVALTILVALGLVGFGLNGPFAHLWSRVQLGWYPRAPIG